MSIFLRSTLGLLCEKNFIANVVLIKLDFHVRRDDLRNKTSSRSRSVTSPSTNDKTSKDKMSKDKKSPKRSKKESSSSSNKVGYRFFFKSFFVGSATTP